MEVGVGGTGDRALGLAAMRSAATDRGVRRGLPLAILGLMAGCSSASQIAGAVTGGVVGVSTGNPALGFAVAVATDAGTSYTFRYVARVRQGAEQDAIAQVAGTLPIGTRAGWKIEHSIPIGDEHGQLQVIRAIDSPLAACREVAFSVEEDKTRAWFITSICKQAETWKWAAAEPAVERWGFLQ